MQRRIALVTLLTLMGLTSVVRGQTLSDDIVGSWYIEGDSAKFDFYQRGDEYCARLVPIANPGLIDTRNPVDSLKNRALAGATLIYGLRFDAACRRWKDGKVYNPTDGKTYSCSVKLAENGTRLLFRGYYGISLLGETRTWRRGEKNDVEVSGAGMKAEEKDTE